MTMTYKTQDTAFSHALYCHISQQSSYNMSLAAGKCVQNNFNRAFSEWHCEAQDLISFKVRWDILSDLITDHFNLAVDPPLWTKPKHVGQNPATTGCLSYNIT